MWIYLLIGIIIVIIIAIGILLYLRSSKLEDIKKDRDRLQEVIQLPFHSELDKLNTLNLQGETREVYNDLNARWQETLSVNKEEAEVNFNEADDHLKKFKFSDSKSNENNGKAHVNNIEDMYDELKQEIDNFFESTKKSERLFEESKQLYREANRDVLADGHKFGDSRKPLESLIDSYAEEIEKYTTFVASGDYVKANSHIEEIYEELSNLKQDMNEIPSLIKEVQKDLPSQFQEIRYGCRDLRLDGYDLDHIKVDSTLSRLRSELNLIEPKIAKLELGEAREDLDRINNVLEEMYDLIEHEVEAKIKYDSLRDKVTDALFKAQNTNMSLRTEVNYIKNQYYINDREVQTIHKFEHEIEHLVTMYSDIEEETNKNTTRYSRIIDNLEYIDSTVDQINNQQDETLDYLQCLKEDEQEAIDNTDMIEDKKENIMHSLQLSNLVTIPEQFVVMKHELDIEVKEIDRYLERRPLNVQYIKEKVNKAVILLNSFEQEAYEIIYDADLAELIIQYANRYRKEDETLDNQIEEATRLFSENRYKRALEIAENALNQVDSEAVNRIVETYENK